MQKDLEEITKVALELTDSPKLIGPFVDRILPKDRKEIATAFRFILGRLEQSDQPKPQTDFKPVDTGRMSSEDLKELYIKRLGETLPDSLLQIVGEKKGAVMECIRGLIEQLEEPEWDW